MWKTGWKYEPTLLNTDIQQVLSSNKDGDVGIAVADKNLSGIVDITAYIEEQNVGVNLLLCDNILSNLFTGLPKKTVIMDKYDISNGYLYRQREKIKRVVAALETTAILKLQDEFESCRIIDKAEVLGIIML